MRTALLLLLSIFALQAADYYPPADRSITNWNLAGPEGGIPSANWPIFVNCRTTGNSSYLCAADGVTDDWQKIYNAISDCPSGQVVYLPEGQYAISREFYFAVKGPFVLRGDGNRKTILLGKWDGSIAGNAYFAFGYQDPGTLVPPAAHTYDLYSGYTWGSSNITTSAAVTNAMVVDDLLIIDQYNDSGNMASGLVTAQGCQGVGPGVTNYCPFGDRPRDSSRNLSQTVRVLSVANGTNITFWPPLNWNFSAALSPQASWMNSGNVIKLVGLEDFTITNVSGIGGSYHIWFQNANQCWAKNIQTSLTIAYHQFWQNTVQCAQVHCNTHGYVGAERPYGTEIRFSTSFLMMDNIFNKLLAAVAVNSGGSGNVIAYNFITNSYTFDPTVLSAAINSSHGAFPMMNLYEGNVVNEIQADAYWGSSGFNTYFRNRVLGTDAGVTVNRKAISLDRNSLSNNVVCNVLGATGIAWFYNVHPDDGEYPYSKNVIYRLGWPAIGNNGYYGPADTTAASYDNRVTPSTIIHGNYDYGSLQIINSNGLATAHLNSYFLSGKPEWMSNSPFPPVGTDIVGGDSIYFSQIPAQRRFNGLDYSNPPTRYGTPRIVRRATSIGVGPGIGP